MIAVTMFHWILFFFLIFFSLVFELWRFWKSVHVIQFREAILISTAWIFLALLFNGWIYLSFGFEPAMDFFTGYLLEKSLSVDNLFVFLTLFAYFKVPDQLKYRVLFHGVMGAIVMRALLIWGGITIVEKFDWSLFVFGGFLLITGAGLFTKNESEMVLSENKVYRFIQRFIPFTAVYHGDSFFIKEGGKWFGTPLLGLLIMVELTDFVFALDSVPAIFGITTDPYIVFTSNTFAILGLRALYFVLEPVMKMFHLLHYALAFILIFIGCKLLMGAWFHIPSWIALLVVTFSLLSAIVVSIIWPEPPKKNRDIIPK